MDDALYFKLFSNCGIDNFQGRISRRETSVGEREKKRKQVKEKILYQTQNANRPWIFSDFFRMLSVYLPRLVDVFFFFRSLPSYCVCNVHRDWEREREYKMPLRAFL